MSTDRQAQARAEAEPYYIVSVEAEGVLVDTNQVEAFVAGVEWADANPAPHTITREVAALQAVLDMHPEGTLGLCGNPECEDWWPCPTVTTINETLRGDEK